MRVLLTTHSPLAGPAAGQDTVDLAGGLVSAGHDVCCLSVEHRGDVPSPLPAAAAWQPIVCRNGDPAADLPFDLPTLSWQPGSSQRFEQLTEKQIDAYRAVLRRSLDTIVAQFDPHLIHCQEAWLWGHLALETGAPYVLTAGGPELSVCGRDPRYRGWVEQAVENAGRLLLHHRFQRQQFLEAFPQTADLAEVVPVPIDLASAGGQFSDSIRRLLKLPERGPMVAFAGNHLPCAGVESLLNAAAVLEAQQAGIAWALSGDGPQRDEALAQARRQGLQSVVFLARLETAQRRALFSAADVVVLPAFEPESARLAIEALGQATPVVAAHSGALPELVSDATGALVDTADHELLAEALLRACAQDWKSRKGPRAAAAVRQQFRLPETVERHVATYDAVLTQRFGTSR